MSGWFLKRATLVAFTLSLLVNLALASGPTDWRIVPAALVGWYLADAASGVVHMVMDYRPCRTNVGLPELFFYPGSRESTDYQAMKARVFGQIGPLDRIVFDFKTHHPRPDALGRRSFVALVWSTIAFTALPSSLALAVVAWLWAVPVWLMTGALTLLVGAALAQYFHASLHRVDPPFAIRLLRRLGLLMTPAAHARHHDSLRRDFATNSGWSNPGLNPIFRRLHARGTFVDSSLEPY